MYSIPYLTKYEKARVIGTRALQISLDSKVFVEKNGETDPYKLAVMEFEQKKIPLLVQRILPNGDVETLDVNKYESL
jgi:DNA-directed RNA polymerase I, II, and III subunit RPABC2